jgi:hypothetical protein
MTNHAVIERGTLGLRNSIFFTHALYAHTDTKNKTIMLLWVTVAMVTDVHTFPSKNADFFSQKSGSLESSYRR